MWSHIIWETCKKTQNHKIVQISIKKKNVHFFKTFYVPKGLTAQWLRSCDEVGETQSQSLPDQG